MSRIRPILFAALSLTAWLVPFAPRAVHACGGFFCASSAPVNQAAERIIFAKNADDTVTAVIQIQYSGPAQEFAWVLPVPGVPDVQVSSDLAFQRLQTASNPQYVATQVIEGECDGSGAFGPPQPGSGPFLDSGTQVNSAPEGNVDVLASGTIGPYDFVVIRPDMSLESIGDVAVEWLTNEGYDVVPPGGDPGSIASLLGTYLQDGMNLLAFRLTKGNDAGTIRPVRITYESDEPMIPIRPTAVAANDDMGVLVWVLGEHRAVPINYRSLELNEALIDWPLAGANYNQVVIAAANEAGGQGFVTERAGASADYDEIVVLPFELDEWDFIESNSESMSAEALVQRSIAMLSTWDGFADVAPRFLHGFLDASGFFVCTRCNHLDEDDFDKAAFVQALAEEVVDPMVDTQELLASRPYVTRLYTTLSAPEMDLDPLFDFNPDLPDAPNAHNATWVLECSPGVSFSDAPWRFELEDGRIIRVAPFEPWPFMPGAEDAPPANALVLQLSTSGSGVIVEDNRATIDAVLEDYNEGRLGSGGCAVVQETPSAALVSVVFIALALCVARRLRRSRGAPTHL